MEPLILCVILHVLQECYGLRSVDVLTKCDLSHGFGLIPEILSNCLDESFAGKRSYDAWARPDIYETIDQAIQSQIDHATRKFIER